MILEFKEPTLDDKKWIELFLKKSNNTASDNAFGTLFIWKGLYNAQVCQHKGLLLRRYGDAFGYPIGAGDIKAAMDDIISASQQNKKRLRMVGLTSRMVDELNSMYKGKFDFDVNRNACEYVYNAEDMACLSGRKYHQKRNHVLGFMKSYEWSYEKITKDNINECMKLFDLWKQNREGTEDEEIALRLALDNYTDLKFIGALIKVLDKPVAFTIGERLNEDTFVVHFEKALVEYKGSYAVINKEFASRELVGYKYINREEDLGIEGIRRAKLSYYPVIILEKFNALLRECE